MRGVIKTLVVASAVALFCAPTQARAEGYVSPFAGVHFGNDQLEKKFVSLQHSLQDAFSGRILPGGRALEESGGSTVSPQVAGFDQIGACPGSPAWLPPQPAIQGTQVPCAAWDPNIESLQNPPGCDWFVTPSEPQPKRG